MKTDKSISPNRQHSRCWPRGPQRFTYPPGSPEPAWTDKLPSKWRPMIVAPLVFHCHTEYEITASRTLGEDEDGRRCYYAHDYLLVGERSDDGEDFYRAVDYGEKVCAWRLRDERWLIYREVITRDDVAPGRSFYNFATECPR